MKVLVLSAAALAGIVAGLLQSPAGAADLYVSNDGSDTNAGVRAKPFRSLERAREEARRLLQGHTKVGPITVWISPGDMVRQTTLELGPLDSGTPAAPVSWRALRPGKTRLLGAVRLSTLEPISDADISNRLRPEARAHVRQSDLAGVPLQGGLQLKSRGFGRPISVAHRELFYAGKPMPLARWPNPGEWQKIAGFPATEGQQDEHGGTVGKLESGFEYATDRPSSWRDVKDIWVHGYWCWDWANSYEQIASIDLKQHLIKTKSPYGLYGFRKDQRFYFLNVVEELDSPGEWFLDPGRQKLYFWPPPVLASPRPELLLSTLAEPFIIISGASNVVVRDLVLEGTRASALEIRDGRDNSVAGCVIRNIGNYGVRIEGGKHHRITSCDIFDTGDGGVSMSGGDRSTLEPALHSVENCHLARQGRWSKCYVPAILMNGVGCTASHNLIHDHPHCAILFNGNDHVIEFNEIHHVALETGDVGAIYTGRDYTYRGNRILHNFIHDTGGVGMGSMGVYMDDCVSGTEIYGNIFYKAQRAVFLGGGRDHQVINNIFVDCKPAVAIDGRGLDKSPVWFRMVDETMRRQLQNVPSDLYRTRYPAITGLDPFYGAPGGPEIRGSAFKGVPPENNVLARNVCAGEWLNVYWHAEPGMVRFQANTTNAESLFVTGAKEKSKPADFELKPDAPVWQLGFEKIPFSQVGLQPDEYRSKKKFALE